MVGVMNAYSFGADKATFVSDVLTRTVQQGVLTMDELAAAIPNVTSLGAEMGLQFGDLAAIAGLYYKRRCERKRRGYAIAYHFG